MAEEHITDNDLPAAAPADTPESLGIDQASYDKYYNDGQMNWQSYSRELEYKMSQRSSAETPQPAQADAPEADAQVAVENAGLDWDSLGAKITAQGDLDTGDYEALAAAGIPEELARNYVRLNVMEAENTVSDVMERFGGEEAFGEIFQALQDNTDLAIRNRIDELLWDPITRDAGIAMALQHAGVQPQQAAAPQPQTPAPAPAPSRANPGVAQEAPGFSSMEEMGLAMRDPRYRTDPTYRAEVERRALGATVDFNPRRHTGGL